MAERAEAVGFDSLWMVDRLLFPDGEPSVHLRAPILHEATAAA